MSKKESKTLPSTAWYVDLSKEIDEKGVITKGGGTGKEYIFLNPLLLNEGTSEVSIDLTNFALLREDNRFTARVFFSDNVFVSKNIEINGNLVLGSTAFTQFNGTRLINIGTPIDGIDGANKKYVDDADGLIKTDITNTLNDYARLDSNNTYLGKQSMAGADMGGLPITQVGAPTLPADATNKRYVDDTVADSLTDTLVDYAKLDREQNFKALNYFEKGVYVVDRLTLDGNILLAGGNRQISGLGLPVNDGDATSRKYVDNQVTSINSSITAIQTNYANKNKANVYKETGTFEKDLNAKIGTFASLITPQVVTAFSPKLLVVNKEALFNVTDAIEVKVNDIDGEQIVDKGNIELNKKNIEALALKQESALKYRGIYDSTETYDKNDIVAIVVSAGKVDTYLSLINNNTQPLSDKASWFETPDLSVSVDLTNYYTKIETNDLLRPLQTDLDTINARITEAVRLINVNIAGITANTAGIAINKTAIGTNKTAIDSNKVNILANNNNINTLNAEVVKLDTAQTIIGDKVFQNGLAISSSNYKVDVNGAEFEFKRGAALANVSGRDANKDTHFITKKQYDEAVANATTAIGNNTTAIATKKSNIAFTENNSVWTGDTQGGKKIKRYTGTGSIATFDVDFQVPNLTDIQQVLFGGLNRKRLSDSKWFPMPFYGNSTLFLTSGTNGMLYFGSGPTTPTDFTNSKFYELSVDYVSTEVATRAEIKEFYLKNTPVENNKKNKNKWYNKKTK